MARRQQRRRSLRAPRGVAPDTTREDASVEAAARRLLTPTTSLESLAHDLRQLRDEAERGASDEPSPDTLRAYRRAARGLREAERALVLIGASA